MSLKNIVITAVDGIWELRPERKESLSYDFDERELKIRALTKIYLREDFRVWLNVNFGEEGKNLYREL